MAATEGAALAAATVVALVAAVFMVAASAVEVSTVAALLAASTVAEAPSIPGWLAVSMAVDSVVVVSAAADSASSHTIMMTTMLMIIRMGMDITHTPTTIRTVTTAVATWFIDACTPSKAGVTNPFKSAANRPS